MLTLQHWRRLRTFLTEGTHWWHLMRDSRVLGQDTVASSSRTLRSHFGGQISWTWCISLETFVDNWRYFLVILPPTTTKDLALNLSDSPWFPRPQQISFCVLQGHKSSLHGWWSSHTAKELSVHRHTGGIVSGWGVSGDLTPVTTVPGGTGQLIYG